MPSVFILPPCQAQTILGVIHASQAASKAGAGHLTGYNLSTSAEEDKDNNKENCQNAATISRGHQDAQGMGTCEGGEDPRRDYRVMEETEDSLIQLYHPWQMQSVGMQHSESPIPPGFNLNHGHHHVPFHIL